MSNHKLTLDYNNKQFLFPPQEGYFANQHDLLNEDGTSKELDDVFFYHQPTSSFTIDSRIPKEIRDPLAEADSCRKSNFLTGASACLRKSVYKPLKKEEIPEKDGDRILKYDDRIDLLKAKFQTIDSDNFDNLKIIHGITSQEVHENEWEDISGKILIFLQEVTSSVLYQIYVMPDEKKKEQVKIAKLKATALGKKI